MTPDWDAKATTVPYAVFGDPQTLNLYSYVENGPLNRVDADGHAVVQLGADDGTIVGEDQQHCDEPGISGCTTRDLTINEAAKSLTATAIAGQDPNKPKEEKAQQTLTAKTIKGGPKGRVFQRQFVLSTASKKGGYIIQYVSANWTVPDKPNDRKIYWEAFRVMPGATSPAATWAEGGADQFSGGFDSQITADAQFYEGVTPAQLNSLFRDTGGKQIKESGSAPSTNKDPHVPTPSSSNILHVSWDRLDN